MALPVPEKTFTRNKNQGPFTNRGNLLYAWKTDLLAAGWTVVRSCGRVGGVTWTAGAADYWATASAILAGPVASDHAWIVLKNTGIATNFQFCLNFINNSGGGGTVMMMYVSASAGFTGGATNARPTALDECDINGGQSPEFCGSYDLTTTPAYLSTFVSSDLECTRWLVYVNNIQTCLMAVDKPKDPVSGWTNPWVTIRATSHYNDGYPTTIATYANLFQANGKARVGQGSTVGAAYLTTESIGGTTTGAIGQQMTFGGDLDNAAYSITPMGIYGTTVGLRGRLGAVYDLWYGSTTPNDGDSYPDDASRQFIHLNDVVMEWGGGAGLIRA